MDQIQAFTCTGPPRREEAHIDPEEWESFAALEAQVGIQSIEFPLPQGEHVIVGRDESGQMAAVCWWIELGGPGRLKLLAAAVSLEHRGAQPRVGDLMMEELFDRVLAAADGAGIETVAVFGLVRRSNGACQTMLANTGFFYVMDVGDLQEWWARLEVPSVDE